MGIKLEERYIKNKLKGMFGELEVYNPQFDNQIYSELAKRIKENSEQVEIENGLSDIQINNTVKIMKYLLSKLTNIEDESYWNDISDYDLENMLNLADGDFKKVINSLLDIMIEVAQDIRIEEIRKLTLLNNKLEEMVEALKIENNINGTLSKFGLDKDKLIKLQQGDEETIKEFQKNLIEQKTNKTKRGRPKTKK